MTSAANPYLANFSKETHQQFHLVVCTQTDADKNRYICGGGLDLGLNQEGLAEAQKIARRFKKNPLKIKRMIASPELRAIQMADIFHDEMRVKLALWRDFSDQFMGEWEGKPEAVASDFSNPPQGESLEAFSLRICKGLEKALQEAGPVLVVTHFRVARNILSWLGLGKEELRRGVMYAIDIPPGSGSAHLREV